MKIQELFSEKLRNMLKKVKEIQLYIEKVVIVALEGLSPACGRRPFVFSVQSILNKILIIK